MGKASRFVDKITESGPQLYYATAVPIGTIPTLLARVVFNPAGYVVAPQRIPMTDMLKDMVKRGHFHKAATGSKPGDIVEL